MAGEDLNPNGKRFTNVKERPIFAGYIIPNGFLHDTLACHALFRYYLSARNNYEAERDNLLAYEGDADTVINYAGLFKGIANWYDVNPEEMAKHWACVDMQCAMLKLPKLPAGDGYRFDKKPELLTSNRKQRRQKKATAKVKKDATSGSD